MENVCYDIKEKSEQRSVIDIDSLIEEVNAQHAEVKCTFISLNDIDNHVALELDYSTNYTVKTLGQILDFYEITKRKLRKDEMIQIIVMFELDPINIGIVENRKRLWENLNELKEHAFFSKFILFELK